MAKEQQIYLQALEHALKVAKNGGVEELEKEVRFRSSREGGRGNMILWDLLRLHTDTNDNIEYVLFTGSTKEIHDLDLIPYACLVMKVEMWEIEHNETSHEVQFKIWLSKK